MEGVREYFSRHSWQNTELKDLLSELEKASGRDLTQWSTLWLETAGVNTLRPDIRTDDDGVIGAFAVLQSAPEGYPTLRPHRLAVGFYDLDDDARLVRVRRIELDVDGERTEIPEVVGEKRPALVLLNDDDLAYAKIRLDPASLRASVLHLRDFVDSLPRTLVWASAWDAARDGETPARQYVDLVLQNIGSESDSSVVLVLLRQLATTLTFYVSPRDSSEISDGAADSLLELARAAEAASDSQLQFLKAFAARARSEQHLDVVEAVLTGAETLEGLSIDSDLRWELVTSLVAGGRYGQPEIDVELVSDGTSAGQLAAATATAAIPTPEAKAAAWDAIVGKADLPNATQRAAILGFTRVHDATLLEPYASKYFDVVKEVWATRTHEIAQQIVVGLYPARSTTPEALAQADGFLDRLGEDSPSLRRLIVENRDGVQRALRAQTVDR